MQTDQRTAGCRKAGVIVGSSLRVVFTAKARCMSCYRCEDRVCMRNGWAPCEVTVPTLNLPAVDHGGAAERHARRRADVALPDATIVELNAQAIGRIDGALARASIQIRL